MALIEPSPRTEDSDQYGDDDIDALHILPLSNIPLATPGLKRARLIKNTRLEGVVELFSGSNTGSGQIFPDALRQAFDFNKENMQDIDLVRKLSILPSYDVFSLRVELRKLGIQVEDHDNLKLSAAKAKALAEYMRVFTRPLVTAVYGNNMGEVQDLRDIIKLFASPDVEIAKINLAKFSKALGVEVVELPRFLEDYGDVYLSLAYYQYCLDQSIPTLSEFFESLSEIRNDRVMKSNIQTVKICTLLERNLSTTVLEIQNVLELFRARTEDMWENLSAPSFRSMQELITSYQTKIGGGLCAVTVKMNAWKKKFPNTSSGGFSRQVEFIMSDMRHGIDRIEGIQYTD